MPFVAIPYWPRPAKQQLQDGCKRAGMSKSNTNPKFVRLIEERHGEVVRTERGIEPGALTGPEATYLANFRDADTLRAAIAEARDERGRRLAAKDVQQLQGVTPEPDLRPWSQRNPTLSPEEKAQIDAHLPPAPEPKPLYASRAVENADDIIDWFERQCVKNLVPAGELHVTTAFSRTPIADTGGNADPLSLGPDGNRQVVKLGDEKLPPHPRNRVHRLHPPTTRSNPKRAA